MSKIIKDLLLEFNNNTTNKISINEIDSDTFLRFTLLDVQLFSEILINKILEEYNSYLNFEYAQFGLDEQDIEEFKKYINKL
jgi:hypothetical protein